VALASLGVFPHGFSLNVYTAKADEDRQVWEHPKWEKHTDGVSYESKKDESPILSDFSYCDTEFVAMDALPHYLSGINAIPKVDAHRKDNEYPENKRYAKM